MLIALSTLLLGIGSSPYRMSDTNLIPANARSRDIARSNGTAKSQWHIAMLASVVQNDGLGTSQYFGGSLLGSVVSSVAAAPDALEGLRAVVHFWCG